MKLAPGLLWAALATGALGCVGTVNDSEEGSGAEAASVGEDVGETVQPVRVSTAAWGFTDCTNHADSDALILSFLTIAAGVESGTKTLPWPFSAIVSGTSALYWGNLATQYGKANWAPGSQGVCVDWLWVPVATRIYAWE